MRRDQAMQFIAAEDIGKILARALADREAFRSRTIEIAGDTVTGDELGQKFGHAAGRSISYQRFPDSPLESDRFLGRLAKLVDGGAWRVMLILSMREADISVRLRHPDQHDLIVRRIGSIAFGL